jgi:hypothetical protein
MPDSKPKTGNIIFYCKDCEQIVDTNRFGNKYVYKCKKCGTKNVAFGTKKSIYSFFHLSEEKEEVKEEKKEVVAATEKVEEKEEK